MSLFPVSKSFLDREALARRIEQEYSLERVWCQLISATLRDVYLITSSQGRYVLYVYAAAQRTREEILAEWQYVDYLHAHDVPVAPVVLQKSGEIMLSFEAPEGTRLGVVTQFVDGVLLRHRSTPATVRAYGQTVARIHVLSDLLAFAPCRAPLNYTQMISDSVTAFEREASDRVDDLEWMRQVAGCLVSKLELLPRDKPSYGMIHGDVIRANALVRRDDSITILDFDFCGWGWRAYDVASYLLTIRRTSEEKTFERAYLDGYNGLRPLTPPETETLPLFEAVRAIYSIGVPAMNMQHWGSQHFYSFVDHDLAALRSYVEKLGIN